MNQPQINKLNNIKNILPDLFKSGINTYIHEEHFKDYVNIYFRNKKLLQEVVKHWGEPEPLQLKFDDRLNMFFLYKEYDPVLGFYHYQDTIQLVPFNSHKLFLAIALILDFIEQIPKLKTKQNKKEKK